MIVDVYEGLQDLLDNGNVTGKDAGKASSVSNFLLKANATEIVYTAIVATSDASEALSCIEGDSGSTFYDVCLVISAALLALAAVLQEFSQGV